MSTYFLASKSSLPLPPPKVPPEQIPLLAIESLDGSRKILLDDTSGWTHMPGATGLEMPPMDVVRSVMPGVPGSVLDEVRAGERPVFIPISAASPDFRHITHRAMMDALRSLVDPLNGMFLLTSKSDGLNRQLKLAYTAGLEGAYGRTEWGMHWRKFGLAAVACQPFAEARDERLLEFGVGSSAGAFLGVAGGTDVPWPRALSSAAVIGDNMRVQISSEVPVYPTLELVGPMDSFSGTVQLENAPAVGGAPWSVTIPDGVPEGSTLRIVTDPRSRSIRMDGQLAAGRVQRGSTLRPFYPGVNLMSVSAPGGNASTRVRLAWRDLYRSLL